MFAIAIVSITSIYGYLRLMYSTHIHTSKIQSKSTEKSL